jgi:subtilisin family serine protease
MTDHQDWDWVPAHPDRPEQHHSQRGLAHPHQLVVDERDWSAVERALQRRDQRYRDKTIKYGLVRITLDATYDSVVFEKEFLQELRDQLGTNAPRFGRNRLATHPELEFDSADVEATPKVISSSVGAWSTADGMNLGAAGVPHIAGPVRVGIVDTPFARHPYLDGACLYAQESESTIDAVESPGHATFVAGLIRQLAPGSVVMAEGAIKPDGIADLVAVHDAICRLTRAGAHLINLSLGCVTADQDEPFVLSHAIEWATRDAREHDRPVPLFVAACGNSGDDKPFWPAADPRVCAVAAVSPEDGTWQLSSYSGRGPWVDVAARGDNLLSSRPDPKTGQPDAYGYWSGTSFATAVVTGLKAAQLARTGAADLAGESVGTIDITTADGVSSIPVYDPDGIQHQ